jgi:hypothetical protein
MISDSGVAVDLSGAPESDIERGRDTEPVIISLIEMEDEEKYHMIDMHQHQLLMFTLYADYAEEVSGNNSTDKFDKGKQFASFSLTSELIIQQDVDDLGCFLIDSYVQSHSNDKSSVDTEAPIEAVGTVLLTMQNIV